MQPSLVNRKKGSTLVIVMIMVIAFALLITALLQLGAFGEQETTRQLRISQAHWLAEAGLERALSWVAASRNFRDDLTGAPQRFGPYSELTTGNYFVELWVPSSSNIVIQSTGSTTAGSFDDTATVELSFRYAAGIPGAIIGLNSPGHTHLNGDVLINDGDVYRNGTLDIDGNVISNHSAYATFPPITGDGIYSENYIPDPEPPIIDEDGRFAGLLNTASTQTNTIFDGALSGTIYVNGDLTLTEGITGSGTLVVNGDLTFAGNDKSISDNVEIVVEGNISFTQHTSLGDHVEVFSENGNISLQHDIDGGTTALIAKNGSLGHIEPEYDNTLGTLDTDHILSSGHSIGDQNPSKPSFEGIFYAEYDIIFRHKADIYGSVIAGRHMDIGHNAAPGSMQITYDPSVFDEDWQLDFGNEIVIINSDWREL